MSNAAHLAKSKRGREDDDEGTGESVDRKNSKRPRRMEVLTIDEPSFRECVRAYKKTDEIINAVEHLKSCTLDGGVDVKLGRVIAFPGYNDDAQKDLVDNLSRGMDWLLCVGFIPYFFHSTNKGDAMVIDDDDNQTSSAGETPSSPTGIIESNSSQALRPSDEIDLLSAKDLEFHVPSLGHGSYRSFKDRSTYLRKVEYVTGREDREDTDITWYVYTQEEPVENDVDATANFGRGSENAMVSSPVARLLPHVNAMRQFYADDAIANKTATMPPYFVQHLPPAKESSKLTTSQLQDDGRANAQAKFGRVRTRSTYKANKDGSLEATNDNGRVRHIPKDVAGIMTREIEIEDGLGYEGLYTPHAYPRISERHNDFVSRVAIAFGVPAHVILAGKITTGSSGGMAGARAGGKESQATGSKGAASSSTDSKKASSGGGFNADPSFNRALKLRDSLQSFFQAVMWSKNGTMLYQAANIGISVFSTEARTRQMLVDELDGMIKRAQDDVLGYGAVIETNIQQTDQLRQNDLANKVNMTNPDMVQKINDANVSAATTKPPAEGPAPKPPAASNISIPESGVEAQTMGIPVPPSVEILNKRRLELINSLQSISDAIKLREEIASEQSPISIRYSQPIINDTSQIQPIIESLGLSQERSYAIAQRRYGLLS